MLKLHPISVKIKQCSFTTSSEEEWCERQDQKFLGVHLYIWEDSSRGIFSMNTDGLKIGEYTTEVLIVEKKDKTGFSSQEVEIWKDILRNIEFIAIN